MRKTILRGAVLVLGSLWSQPAGGQGPGVAVSLEADGIAIDAAGIGKLKMTYPAVTPADGKPQRPTGVTAGKDAATMSMKYPCGAALTVGLAKGGAVQCHFTAAPAGAKMRMDKAQDLPSAHNQAVMRVQRQFVEEVKHRQAEREHTLSLTHGQRYVLRELRVLFGLTGDEDVKGQINLLEKAFRAPITRALNQELNRIRRNGITGQHLLKLLSDLYLQHNMREWLDRPSLQLEDKPIPRIVCSEALI